MLFKKKSVWQIKIKKLIVILPNENGICLAIKDRVTKAAAKS
jgi:hypothetical protein